MAIDGFFIKHLINELNEKLINLRVLKISQVKKDIFIFHFNKSGEKIFLNMKVNSPNSSVFLTDHLKESDKNYNTGLILNLKRLLESSILTNIKQHSNDRVLIIEFTTNDFLVGKIKREIIFEIMGRYNNLILTENNIIIDAYNKAFNANARSIIPKGEFSFFHTNKIELDKIDYTNVLDANYLSKNFVGYSKLLSEYLYRHKTDVNEISVEPTLNLDTNKYYWFNLFSNDNKIIKFNSLSKLFEKLVYEPSYDYTLQNNFINKQLIRLNKRLDNLENDLVKAKDNLGLKDIGNLIYASGLNLDQKYSSIKDFSNNSVALDANYTLKENAQRAFKKYSKASRAITFINENIDTTKEDINELLTIQFHLTLDDVTISEINQDLVRFGFKNKQRINPNKRDTLKLLKINYLDTIIYVGKNNKQNDYITHSLSSHNDLWLHAEKAPGSHVLIKDNNPSDKVLEFAAMLAAKYSTLKLNHKVNVNYTQIRNLKKIPKKPGHMVSMKSFNTITIIVDDKLINDVLIANKLI